jgi:hypothetical protein
MVQLVLAELSEPKRWPMKIIVCLLGIAHIAISSIFILYTKETIDMLKGMSRTYKLKYMAS